MASPYSKRGLLTLFRQSTLLKTATGNLSLKVVAAALGLLNTILFARILSPAEYGVYLIAMAAVTLVGTLATLGLPSLVTREVAGILCLSQVRKALRTLSARALRQQPDAARRPFFRSRAPGSVRHSGYGWNRIATNLVDPVIMQNDNMASPVKG
jgi:hypothetical protein